MIKFAIVTSVIITGYVIWKYYDAVKDFQITLEDYDD